MAAPKTLRMMKRFAAINARMAMNTGKEIPSSALTVAKRATRKQIAQIRLPRSAVLAESARRMDI